MEKRIDPDALLDYVELQIFPSDNRYEACVSISKRAEKAASGDLQQLLLHLPQVKDLSSKTSDSNFRILPPDDVKDANWFTTTTLRRFLNVVGSPDILNIGNEISQLEETKKFQLTLFAKAEVNMTSSFESKNELLRAVDSRLSGLIKQLTDALNQATGARCTAKDISNLESFAHHFGAEDIRDSLQKFLESGQPPLSKNSTTKRNVFTSQPSQVNPPVKYSVSPAKAAQIERQDSTDSENSFSSEEDQPSVERSRTVARSATPRRSASPMRRVQIGRTGPRRSAALSIRSLSYFPNREKTTTQRDATGHSSEEEKDSEKSAKNNALRMSVQDKISLFESKKKDQPVETKKSKTLLTAGVPHKAVLRRWSSGMSESVTQCLNDTSNESFSLISHKDTAPVGNPEFCSETVEKVDAYSTRKGGADILNVELEQLESEKHPDSIEWNQQKEAELNQLFKTMMESKSIRRHSVTNDNSKSKSNTKEQRGGFYDHYKQKRDEKLRKEASGKKAEKESQFKEMEKFLDERKAEMASTNASDGSRKKTTASKVKPQNSKKSPTQMLNTKKEVLRVSVIKKTSVTNITKPSTLPVTRKSFPSTPSPRPTGASPASTPTPSGLISSSANIIRKPQSTSAPAVRSTTKVEKPQPRSKTSKATQPDAKTNIKTVTEKKQPTITKSAQKVKPKPRTQVDSSGAVATTNTTTAKPSFYNKVTKKSSVVPLETKPFLRKGTGIVPPKTVVKSKVLAQPEEPLILAEENQVVKIKTTEIASQNQEKECEQVETETETETKVFSPIKYEEPEISNQLVDVSGDETPKKIELTENNDNTGTEEESTISISPTAWVEKEEQHHRDEIIPFKESAIQVANVDSPAGVSSPRVRHSLFQMLLEETSEPDSCEWGNAQHLPAVVNQKDAPKGFKRLLKFARKTKADLHDGSSPSSIFRRG